MKTTTAATANPAAPILAIDLGKYKSVCCLYCGSPDSARFDSFPTDRARLCKLLERYRSGAVVIGKEKKEKERKRGRSSIHGPSLVPGVEGAVAISTFRGRPSGRRV